MSNTKLFIENIQGLLVYLKNKNGGYSVALRDLLEKDQKTFEFILEEYNENSDTVLESYFKKKDRRDNDLLHLTLFDTHLHFKDDYSDEMLKEKLKEAEEYVLKLKAKIPSKFQELYSFATVDYLLDELMKAAPILGCNISKRPEIATVSAESVNACTFLIDNSDPVIFVEEDILSFIHLFSKVFCQCLSLGKEDIQTSNIVAKKEDVFRAIDDDPEIVSRFKDFLVSYIIEGSPRKSEQYNLKKDIRYWVCTHLMISAELFLIGHELGHYIAGHQTSSRKFGFYNQEANAVYANYSWEKEFEADRIGMYLAMQAMALKGFQADFCYLGIEPFFILSDIALKARKILKDGNEDISGIFKSHPPNQQRKENTRKELKAMTEAELYLNAIYLPNLISETMEYLWEKSKDIFYLEYEKRKNSQS